MIGERFVTKINSYPMLHILSCLKHTLSGGDISEPGLALGMATPEVCWLQYWSNVQILWSGSDSSPPKLKEAAT
jgi:hypothetical protein